MTTAGATEEALDVARRNKKSHDENDDSENEDCSIMEQKVTASAVQLVRNVFVRIDQQGAREKEILRYLSIMEDTFLANDIAGRQKKSTLGEFFT